MFKYVIFVFKFTTRVHSAAQAREMAASTIVFTHQRSGSFGSQSSFTSKSSQDTIQGTYSGTVSLFIEFLMRWECPVVLSLTVDDDDLMAIRNCLWCLPAWFENEIVFRCAWGTRFLMSYNHSWVLVVLRSDITMLCL